MNRLFSAAVALVLALSGLALVGCFPKAPEQGALTTCRAYDATLTTLASYRAAGKLDADEEDEVNKWRSVLNPICADETPPEGSDFMGVLSRGVRALTGIEEANE